MMTSLAVQMLGKMKNKINTDDLFDESLGYEDETGIKIASNLTADERQQAVVLYRLFNELWGVCIVAGAPGTGKDLFGNYLAHKIKRYFPWKRILRDERPRKLFGEYAGLFNESVLSEELERMRALGKGAGIAHLGKILDKAADDWVTESGQVLLKNSVLYLTEYWRYCPAREPFNLMNRTLGAIHKMKRHLDCLIIGTIQLPSELDKKTCLPWVDWKVTCTHSVKNKTGFIYYIQKVKYDRRLDILDHIGKPFPMAFDAGRPRDELGDGKILISRPEYKPATEEEKVVLAVLRAGAETYKELVEFIETTGNMCEREILDTLKELQFRRSKRAISYPCFFFLFNSKSVPQIKTKLRISE